MIPGVQGGINIAWEWGFHKRQH
uniref:Uncharacterized protein n=1 Tax=Ralstonia solanacearum TaxID=305 RepID=A0A0S4WZ87_RALSL|nr:protein of unknown function [Ralstonia solanacearum]CUV56914.1 protein of unknown function [Ralstonia solanacearum]